MRALATNKVYVQRQATLQSVERSVLVDIGEEAYKQNTVYCSWHEIISSHTTVAKPELSTRQEQASAEEFPRSVR
jgi:hypothetical protein